MFKNAESEKIHSEMVKKFIFDLNKLLARALEEKGSSTVTLNMFAEMAYQIIPPRTILTEFPLGAPFGAPENKELQLKVIQECLKLLVNNDQTGVVIISQEYILLNEKLQNFLC